MEKSSSHLSVLLPSPPHPTPSSSKPMMKQLETPAFIPTILSTSSYPSILPLQPLW